MNTAKKLPAVALVSAAAALILGGCASYSTDSKTASAAQVHCSGINSCKGTSECKTATNACKGQNSCKGQGWIPASKAECSAKGGKVIG